MFKSHFKIAFRNLLRHKSIAGINLFGLTIGIACCLLILAYILNELSFDTYNPKAKNIYRVERTFLNPETGDLSLELGSVAPPFAPYLLNDFKEIKTLTRLLSNGITSFKYGDKIFNERDVYFADENLFSLFKVDVLQGNAATALKDPFTIMLTEDVAKKYFGTEDPMGKEVRLNNQISCKVTGIYKPFPAAAHLHPALMVSFNTLKDSAVYGEENLRTNWGNNSFLTYIELPDNYDPAKMEAQFPAFQNRHIPADDNGKIKPSDYSKLSLKKLTDIHLRSHTDYEAEQNGDIKRVYIFSAVALFILLIACINYMNLSTARSVLRAKEIGVRKVVGARKPELMAQFLSESVLLSWLATLLAFGLTAATLPWLSDLVGQELSLHTLLTWKVMLPLLVVPFVVGILSGLYPAVFLSSFQPIKVLKGLMKVGGANISFRKVLVVVQFSISIILIIATVVIFQQLRYMQSKSLGFNKDGVLNFAYPFTAPDNSFDALRTELLSHSGVQAVARSSRIPSGRLLDAMGSELSTGNSSAPTKADIKYVVTDEGFVPAFGVRMVAGRNFSKEFGGDTSAFLLNEAAVKALGLKSPEEAIGKGFTYGGRKGQLIGVVNDFHFESLRQRILPMVFYMQTSQGGGYNGISIKISGNNVAGTLAHIEKVWKKALPDIPFDFTYIDSRFEQLYQSEARQRSLFTAFAGIAIFIACLGLLGLSAFAISQRVKEIGIRKVLGANAGSIVGLLSKDFLKPVAIAALIAFPLAWLAMNKWLEDFAYRISVAWWVFLLAAFIAAIIAFATVAFQALKAANANPVKSLRTE